MTLIMLSGVLGLIIKNVHATGMEVLPDLLLLLGACVQFLLHGTFFFVYVAPLAYRLIGRRLGRISGDIDQSLLPSPAWFPSIVGIASIIVVSQRFYQVGMRTPNLPDAVDSELVLTTLRAIMYVALGNVAVFVPVVSARTWSDLIRRCRHRVRRSPPCYVGTAAPIAACYPCSVFSICF